MDPCNIEFSEIQRRFDEIVSELPAYGATLAKIKSSYESVMMKIKDCNRVRSVINLQETQHSLRGNTLRNFRLCEKEYESKLSVLLEENERLRESIKTHKEKQYSMKLALQKEREVSVCKARMNSGRRRKLNLTIQEATDVCILDRELKRVEQELEDIKLTTEKRHVPLSKKLSLQIQLQDKEKEKLKLQKDNKYLGCLFLQLSAGLKCAASVYSSLQSGATHDYTMAEQLSAAIHNIDGDEIERVIEDLNEEDPDEEKEAEFTLFCKEKFHELFDSEQYEEAALLAATSPMGSLRNIETLEKFKAVSSVSPQIPCITPLLHYCSTLMHSANLFKPLSARESLQFVSCALECGQYDRLMNWVASGNLPVSKEMAMIVLQRCSCLKKQCVCHCCEIALMLFEKLGHHIEAAMCLAKLGMYNKLYTFINEKNLQRNDVISLLYSNPIKEFALSLVCPPLSKQNPLCDILEVVFIICQTRQYAVCEDVLKEYADHYSTTIGKIFDNANRNPAYTELLQSLLKTLTGTELQWMVIEILASRIVLTALENVLSEIQEKCNKESLIDLHNSQTSAILREQNETIISEELISNNQTTPITRQSQHRLVRSGNINISSSNTSSSDIETSDSYNDEQSSTQNSSDELNY